MNASQLPDWVWILKRDPTSDGQGGRTVTWVDLVTETEDAFTRLSGSVMPVGARESLQAAAINSEVSFLVTMRYRADVDDTMRVQWRPFKATTVRTLQIHGVTPLDGGRVYIVLWCSETK